MPRHSFTQELQRIQDEILTLGSMSRRAILSSVDILQRRDSQAARALIAADRAINAQRLQVEADCLALIATQQPMARDMRLIAGVLEIATELERMGDYGKGIARIVLLMNSQPGLKALDEIPLMAHKVVRMLEQSLTAFTERDVALAQATAALDDEVDELYNQVYRELVARMIADPSCIDQANYLMWAAHNMERAGDRCTNICERAIYTVTGEMRELDVDDPSVVAGIS